MHYNGQERKTMRLIRSIATVGLYTIGSRIVGFMRTTLMASLLGAGAMADALVIAIKIPSVFRRLCAEGAFNAAFVPIFAGLLAKEGHEPARRYAEEIFSILVLFLSLFILVAEVFMPQLIPLIVSGFTKTPDRLAYTIEYTRITFPFLLFISVSALYSGILNSFEKFSAAASAPMIGNMAILATVYLLKPLTGDVGKAFAVGITVCGIAQALWVLVPAWRAGMRFRLHWPKFTPSVMKFIYLLGPAAFGAGIVQINIFLDMIIASYLPLGSVSFLEYADRLNQLPLSVIGIAIGTALLPLLSKQIRLGDYVTAHKTQNLALEYALVLAMPATFGFIILAFPMAQTVYQHGKLTLSDAYEVSHTLTAFAIGLPAYILVKIFSTIFFAQEDTKTPVYVACMAVVVNFCLNLMLFRTFSHTGLAFSTAVSAWFNAGVLAYRLHRKAFFILSERFKKFLPKMLLSCVVTMTFLQYMTQMLWKEEATLWIHIRDLTVLISGGVILYVALCFGVGIFKLSDLRIRMQGETP
jgi:putative peptidoglycan lipid II flippase